MGKTTTDAIRIYVANLGAYNAGHLIGEWLELPMDADELDERLNAIISAVDEDGDVYGEEWAIHDYEAPFTINEYDNVNRINEIAEIIAASDEDADVIEAILGNWSDVDDGLAVLESGDYTIHAACKDMSDVAYGYAEDCGDIKTLDASKINGVGYAAYIDWERVGRDMEINGTFISYNGTYDVRGTYTGGYVEIHG